MGRFGIIYLFFGRGGRGVPKPGTGVFAGRVCGNGKIVAGYQLCGDI